MAASSPASMSTASPATASLCIATPAAGRILAPALLVSIVFPPAASPDVANPGRVIATRMVDNILLLIAHVGHVARLREPRPARSRVVLDLVAGPDAGAGYRVAPSIPGIHGLNHIDPLG